MNKRLITLLILFISIHSMTLYSQQNEWEDPVRYEWNKEKPHVDLMFYQNTQDAIADDYSRSPWYKSLNGKWKFIYSSTIENREKNFYKTNLEDKNWANIDVPSNWEMLGFGYPIYANIPYLWSHNPPYIDIDIPVGTYRKTFTVPDGWNEKEILLHFGSITGYAQVYLNGERVGMTKAAKTPAEFNITKYLRSGENLLAVQVYKWHDGSYLEDQDFWRLAGIERDVFIQAYDKLTIWDFFLKADLDTQYKNGLFNATVDLREFKGNQQKSGALRMQLIDQSGKSVLDQQTKFNVTNEITALNFAGRINNVNKWSAEKPYLYDCIITLLDENGREVNTTAYKTGFRKVEIKNAKLHVNGVPTYIKGVNRHEHNDTLGHVQNREIMMHDLKLMKELNINAIRLSHYPTDPLFYKLCDLYGFYLVDEANIETHGMGSVPYFKDTVPHPAYRPEWYDAHVDRITRMVERSKNHASIIGWSLGNECGNGKVFHDEYARLKAYDPSRFVQFEQAWEDSNTDVVCPMYPNYRQVETYRNSGKQRPYIMCEYAHGLGNSNGNFQDLWDLIYDSPNLQGGFIWDWMEQGIRVVPDGDRERTYWKYKEKRKDVYWITPDHQSTADGIIASDGTPKPQAYEIKKVHQYIQFFNKDLKRGIISIKNRYDFTNLDEYNFSWELYKNGTKESSGTFSVSLKPHQERDVQLSLPKLVDEDRNEYYLNVFAYTKKTTGLLPANYEVAKEQFKLNSSSFFDKQDSVEGNLTYDIDGDVLSFKSGNISGKFNLKKGELSDYEINGKQPIKRGMYPEPAFWRAPVDGDFGNKMHIVSGVWRTAGYNKRVSKVTLGDKNTEGIPIKVEFILADIEVPYTIDYLIKNDGSIQIISSIDMKGRNLAELPRFGMRMTLESEYDNLSYYGRGPLENYVDRWTSSFVGKYEDNVDNQYYNYIRPQESGNKTDVRWLTLLSNNGVGLQVQGLQPIAFSAIHFTPEDLDPGLTKKMQQSNDIIPRKEVILHVDLKQRGLGGDNTWGQFPYKQYRLLDKEYSYGYTIKLIEE